MAPFLDLATDNVIISLPSSLLVWVCRLQFSRGLRGTAEVWKKIIFLRDITRTRISRNIYLLEALLLSLLSAVFGGGAEAEAASVARRLPRPPSQPPPALSMEVVN